MKENMLKTALIGESTTKTNSRIIFFGTVDELSSYIMELTYYIKSETKDELIEIINNLSNIMGIVAGSKSTFGENELNKLLSVIKKYKTSSPVLEHFVLPGQTLVSAKIHIVRTVARRAELAYAKVYEEYYNNTDIKYNYLFEYLNKLSTFFYELALYNEKNPE